MGQKIKSVYIKIYPTAYRGEHTDQSTGNKRIFNPASRLFTEENITKSYVNSVNYTPTDPNLLKAKDKGSYVISTSKTAEPFEFVICGYYFKITKNNSTDGLLFPDDTKTYYAKVNIRNLGTDDSTNTKLVSNYLSPFTKGMQTLDIETTASGQTFYQFDGLEILDSFPSDYDENSTEKYLLLCDKGNIPATSIIRFERESIHGGEDRPLSDFLKTNQIRVLNNIIDADDTTHITEIDFVNSKETIKNVEATVDVKTPKVITYEINNENAYGTTEKDLKVKSKKPIQITASGNGDTTDSSLILLKTTGDQACIKLETSTSKSDINIKAEDSIHLTAKGTGNDTGRYITLQSAEDAQLSEWYVLPSTSEQEPQFSNQTPHILATREWINQQAYVTPSNTQSGVNNYISWRDGDEEGAFEVQKVRQCITADNSDKAYVDLDTAKAYLVTSTTTSSNYVQLKRSSNNIYTSGSGLYAGSMEASGTIKALTFNATSDKRLKENIKLYKSEKSILDLPVYKYDFIEGSKNQIGCMAQELKEICPEIVNSDDKGILSIQESKIVYLLLEEVKKLNKKVQELEERLK